MKKTVEIVKFCLKSLNIPVNDGHYRLFLLGGGAENGLVLRAVCSVLLTFSLALPDVEAAESDDSADSWRLRGVVSWVLLGGLLVADDFGGEAMARNWSDVERAVCVEISERSKDGLRPRVGASGAGGRRDSGARPWRGSV